MKNKFHVVKNYFSTPRILGDIKLYQVGRRFCAEGMVVSAHKHMNWFELTVVINGRGIAETDGVCTEIKSGDIYLSYPSEVHKIVSDADDPLKYDFIAFETTDQNLGSELEEIMQFYPPDARVFNDEKLSHLLGNIIVEANEPSRFSDELLHHMLKELIIYVIRNRPGKSRSVVSFGGITDSEALCLQLMNYIDTNIYTINNLSRLSEITGYSYNYLSNVFKQNTSSTLLEYYHTKRMKTAQLLLSENKRSICNTAELLGYSSIYTFSRAFRKHFGISPSDYKKQMSKGK